MSLSTVKITQLTPAVTLNARDLFVIANKTNTSSPETHSLSAQLIYDFIANQNVLNFLPISGGNLTGPLFAPEATFTSLTASSATINIINITQYELSGFRVLGDLSIYGNVSGFNLRTSFGMGSSFGDFSFAEGVNTTASGYASHAEGATTVASGDYSHAEGATTVASGDASHAQGLFSTTNGLASFASGWSNFVSVSADYGIALGNNAFCNHSQSYIWNGGTFIGPPGVNFSTSRSQQYVVNAPGGTALYGNVGIGTDSIANALTVNGNVSSSRVIYSNELDFGSLERPSLTGIKQALNSFLYVSPALSYVRINGSPSQTLEVGQALTTPAITWNSNKVEPQAVSQYILTLGNGNISTGNFTFSSFNDPNTYNITTIGGTATQQTSSWSVRVTDWAGAQATGTASANWRYRAYFGVTSSATPNSTDILNGVTSETNRPLATGRLGLGIKSVIPSNQYFYVAYPQRFGTTSTLKVNGLNFNDFTQQSIATFTNASGGTDSYYVYRSNNLLTATYDIEIA
jgi:hypothetical protein